MTKQKKLRQLPCRWHFCPTRGRLRAPCRASYPSANTTFCLRSLTEHQGCSTTIHHWRTNDKKTYTQKILLKSINVFTFYFFPWQRTMGITKYCNPNKDYLLCCVAQVYSWANAKSWLDLRFLVGPFQLGVFYDSVIRWLSSSQL